VDLDIQDLTSCILTEGIILEVFTYDFTDYHYLESLFPALSVTAIVLLIFLSQNLARIVNFLASAGARSLRMKATGRSPGEKQRKPSGNKHSTNFLR
jgi:hypothetical protein